MNPNDFAQSVENLFYVSFLIRDGECAFEITDEGEPRISECRLVSCPYTLSILDHPPMVVLCEQPTFEDRLQGIQRQQIVMEFDMATWQASRSLPFRV